MQAWTPSQSIRQARRGVLQLPLQQSFGILTESPPPRHAVYRKTTSTFRKIAGDHEFSARTQDSVDRDEKEGLTIKRSMYRFRKVVNDHRPHEESSGNGLVTDHLGLHSLESPRLTRPSTSEDTDRVRSVTLPVENVIEDVKQDLPAQGKAGEESVLHPMENNLEKLLNDRVHLDSPGIAVKSSIRSKDLVRPPVMLKSTYRSRTSLSTAEEVHKDDRGAFFRDVEDVRRPYKSNLVRAIPLVRVPKTVFHLAVDRSLRDNLKEAPFSTLFYHNPYAHALAAPVREDSLTGAHLPTSCLLAFHMVQSDESDKDISLFPVSLAADLISKKKTKLSPDEEISLSARQEVSSFATHGSASYMHGSTAAVQLVSQAPGNNVASLAIGRRSRSELQEQNILKSLKWRNDMPSVILETLRKVVTKKLGWLFRDKANKNSVGMIFEILPGIDDMDLSRINDADDLSCVLQLTLPSAPGSRQSFAEQIDDADAEIAAPIRDLHAADIANNIVESRETVQQDQQEDVDIDQNISSEPDPIESESEHATHTLSIKSKLHKRQTGWWVSDVSRTLHARTRPLPPPLRPLRTKFPTILFRNRTVPIYNLPKLLGEKYTTQLIKGTVFEKSKYVALGIGRGTVTSQEWLLRLQIYVAEERSYKAMRRERRWMREWVGEVDEGEEGVDE